MPKVDQIYLKIADKLAETKNYLYEIVQKKIDEGKEKDTIIKEIKKEFAPNESVICDIENTFFKTAYIGSGINELYEEGEISDDTFNTIGRKYREMESQIAPLFGQGKYQNQEEFERAFAKWIRAAYPNIYDRVASKETIDLSDIPEIDFSKVSYIKKLKDKEKWRVYSESGKNLGTYDSMKDAKSRLKEIEFFKRKKSNNPYLQKQATTLIGKEIQLKNDTVIKFNEFNVAVPTTAFGIITKENPIIAQFDIDDIQMFKSPNGKLYYTKEEVEEEFQKKYGHFWEMQVNLDEINITGAESNVEAGSKIAESWLEQAKPGDKVQLDGGETGEVLNVSDEKVEVKTPTKTETVWKTKKSDTKARDIYLQRLNVIKRENFNAGYSDALDGKEYDFSPIDVVTEEEKASAREQYSRGYDLGQKHQINAFSINASAKDQILSLLATVFGGSWGNVVKAIEEYKQEGKSAGVFDKAKVWLMITLMAALLGTSAQDVLAGDARSKVDSIKNKMSIAEESITTVVELERAIQQRDIKKLKQISEKAREELNSTNISDKETVIDLLGQIYGVSIDNWDIDKGKLTVRGKSINQKAIDNVVNTYDVIYNQ